MGLEYILYLIMESCLIFWAIMYTSNIQINVKRILFCFSIVILPAIPIFQLGQWYGIGYFLSSIFILFYWISKRSITFIHICFVFIIGILMDHLTQIILNFFQIQTRIELLGQFILFSLLFVLAIVIYKQATRKMYTLIGGAKIASLLILLVGLFTVSTFYINIYLSGHVSGNKIVQFNILSQIIYFGFMLIVLYFTIKTLKRKNEFKKIQFETAHFKDYIQSLELINNDMQKFQHDYSNILFTMQGYMENDNLEGLKEYFKEHIVSTEADTFQLNKRLANLSNLQIPGLKGLIVTKTLQAENEGIVVNIEIPEVIDSIDMNIIEVARTLGIFFDNAIEANKDSNEQKEINFALFKSISESTIMIVENTFTDDLLQMDDIFKEGYSTKGDNRGKGLSNVKSIINHYPNATLTTNLNNGLFTQIVELSKSEVIK